MPFMTVETTTNIDEYKMIEWLEEHGYVVIGNKKKICDTDYEILIEQLEKLGVPSELTSPIEKYLSGKMSLAELLCA